MASFDEIGKALRDDAVANAPRASAIDVDAVTHAARARRRPRQWALGTLSVVAALGVGGLAVVAGAPPVMIAATESADSTDLMVAEEGVAGQADESERAQVIVECGGAPPPRVDETEGLLLEAELAARAPANGQSIEGTIELTNTSASAVSISTRPTVGGVLVLEGVRVGSDSVIDDVGLATELQPGQSLRLPLLVETTECATGAPLAAGDYLVRIEIEVVDSTATDTTIVSSEIGLRLD